MLLRRAWVGDLVAVILWAFFSLIPSRQLCLAQKYQCPRDELLRLDSLLLQ
jgi:hypothetical protein